MKNIVLVGAGGHCRSVLDSLLNLDLFDKIVILDPNITVGEKIYNCEVVGSDDSILALKNEGFEYAFVTIGGGEVPSKRIEYIQQLQKLGYKIPNIIDSSSIVSKNAVLGSGVFIGKKAVVNAGAVIGNHCIINSGAIIEHDCIVDEYSHVSVGAILCGKTKVGRASFIGAGTTVIQNIEIKDNVIIGANSTVIRNIENDTKCYGVVKRI